MIFPQPSSRKIREFSLAELVAKISELERRQRDHLAMEGAADMGSVRDRSEPSPSRNDERERGAEELTE